MDDTIWSLLIFLTRPAGQWQDKMGGQPEHRKYPPSPANGLAGDVGRPKAFWVIASS